MNAFVSVIRGSLVYDRSAGEVHCSVYKPEAIFKGSSFFVNCCSIDIEHCRDQNIVILVSNSVPMVGIQPVRDFITNDTQLWN